MGAEAIRSLTHEEAVELAPLYVLNALETRDREAVRRHLTECDQGHSEFEAAAGVASALALLIEPVDPPRELRDRVMAAIAQDATADAGPAQPDEVAVSGHPTGSSVAVPSLERGFRHRWSGLAWAAAAAAVVMIAVLGAWNVMLQARTNELEQRTALIADAIAARAAPGAEVGTLRGTGPAAGATGFAAFTPEGEGYVVLVGLPPAPEGQTYQAWYIVDGEAFSAGVVSVGDDGYAVLAGIERLPGADLIAFTLERAGGVGQPTSDPIVTGDLEDA